MLIATKLPCHTNLHSTIVSSWLLSQTSFISSVSFVFLSSQYIPVSEVPGGVGVSFACWLCAGVQVWVPVALLAFPSQCLRFLQISGAGKRMIKKFSASPKYARLMRYSICWSFSPPSLFQAFSFFFVFVALTSDIICLLFIPVQWLFFAASTYVWVQYVWHTGQFAVSCITAFCFCADDICEKDRICNLPTDPLAGWKAP